MSRIPSLVAVLGLACAAPSRTSERAAGAAPAAPADEGARKLHTADARNPVVCRMERPIGSNYARRVCFRQEDLDRSAREAQDAIRQAIRASSTQAER